MNLKTFRPKQKPTYTRKPTGNRQYDGFDLKLIRWLRVEMNPGSRNQTCFKSLCHCFREYGGKDLDAAIDTVHDAAAGAGLDEAEWNSILQSAQRTQAQKQEKK